MMKMAELNKLPGCSKNSWGYHSDDGNFFDCSETEEPYGPKFETGDTIGCCFNFRNNTVLYIKNGVNLGIAFRDLKNDLYYPCIGIRSKGGLIEANFGHEKFKYMAITDDDIDDDPVKEKWIETIKQYNIEDFKNSLNSLKIGQKNTLKYCAKAYFIMGEYKEACKDLTKLLEIEQNNEFALKYRGEIYLILNKYEESYADLKKLLEISKDDEWALEANIEVRRR
ncbi:concanavalin A-like lectin/glucanase domain-containing protein [Gigaspora rosea]|uniref:Concanavalin A-like lectin/glucanase domain-containing protein n=1 Tax=Gigaspora rosea TaxID=44941 RepID=A0A397TYZ9_9GLOM|nr:concanavalin A-like lectin/glucanase domain-containing protein [Gigaspora rosea]